jgi:hypothetical protein
MSSAEAGQAKAYPTAALVLAPEAPYPLVGGGALRTASLIQYLAQTRPVDLILFRQPGAPDPLAQLPPGLARRVSVIQLPPTGRGQVARAVRNAGRMARRVPPLVDRFAGFEREVAAAIGDTRYGVGVIEHSWCAPYWEQLAPACRTTVLDLHNIESILHQRCAAVDPPAAAMAHRLFGSASLELERTWLPRFHLVLATSESDAATAKVIAPSANLSVYPNAIPAVPVPTHTNENVVVFTGNMEYHPNLTAVRFFRTQVWPILRERWPGLIWRLAPLLTGSGTRLKILEAWAAAVPVVSTTLGAEGLPIRDGEHLLLADGASAFATAVSRVMESTKLSDHLGQAGRLLLEEGFTWIAAWKKLDL